MHSLDFSYPKKETHKCRDEQSGCVVTQPSKIQGDLNSEVVTDLIDGLSIEESLYPFLLQFLQLGFFMNREHLVDDFGAKTSGY